MFSNKNKGFTLIELLVVISIITLLSSVVMTSLSNARAKARDIKRIAELRSIEKALYLYSLNNKGLFPLSFPSSQISDFFQPGGAYTNPDGSVNCNNPVVVNYRNSLYTTLVNGKYLASKPADDPVKDKGYCPIYFIKSTDIDYSDPVYPKARSGMVVSFLEKTKTLDGYQALTGVGVGVDTSIINLNINLTTGVKLNVNYGGSGN